MFETAWALAIVVALQSTGTGPAPAPQAPTGSTSAWTDDRPLTRLFPNLIRDLKAVPTVNTAIVLSVGGAGAAAVHPGDARFANWSAGSGNPAYAAAGQMLGHGWVQAGGAVAAYTIGKLARKSQVVHISSDLIRAQVLNGLITGTIKVAVDRTRPSGGHLSFPSGHTSASFASAATLHAHYGWKAGGPAFGVAGFIAWTRVRNRAHWLSDVAFGAAIGIVAGRTVAARHQPRRVTVVPTPTKGGGAIYVYLAR